MNVKLLTEHHLQFLSLKWGGRGSSESTHVKMPHCWKSHALAHFYIYFVFSSTIYTFQYEALVTPGNELMVHHILVYRCHIAASLLYISV